MTSSKAAKILSCLPMRDILETSGDFTEVCYDIRAYIENNDALSDEEYSKFDEALEAVTEDDLVTMLVDKFDAIISKHYFFHQFK